MRTIEEEWQDFAKRLPGEPPDEFEQVSFYTGYQAGYCALLKELTEHAASMTAQVRALAGELGIELKDLKEAAARVAERQERLQ